MGPGVPIHKGFFLHLRPSLCARRDFSEFGNISWRRYIFNDFESLCAAAVVPVTQDLFFLSSDCKKKTTHTYLFHKRVNCLVGAQGQKKKKGACLAHGLQSLAGAWKRARGRGEWAARRPPKSCVNKTDTDDVDSAKYVEKEEDDKESCARGGGKKF